MSQRLPAQPNLGHLKNKRRTSCGSLGTGTRSGAWLTYKVSVDGQSLIVSTTDHVVIFERV